jgi:hypothetical protein
MVAAALSLFFFCTFDVAIGLLHNFLAFIESTDPDQEFQKVANWVNMARVSAAVYLSIKDSYICENDRQPIKLLS